MLPSRSPDAHKGRFGHLLLVAGSPGRGGAVAMAAKSAVVIGSGLVTMAVPDPVVPVVDAACLEAMTHTLFSDDTGAVAGEKGLEDILDRMTAVAAGPGLGTGDGADKTITWLLENWKGPLLLDADAINLLAGSPERLAGRDVPAVLTPHPGELARLLGRSTVEILPDRLGAAREAARRSGAIVVAKGYGSIIAEPAGQAWVNPTGDVGLASPRRGRRHGVQPARRSRDRRRWHARSREATGSRSLERSGLGRLAPRGRRLRNRHRMREGPRAETADDPR